MRQPAQLPLAVQLPDDKTFAGFHPSGKNKQLIKQLKRIGIGQGPRLIYIWSPPGMGRTHLLYATCAVATASGNPCCYLPLNQQHQFQPTILESFEKLPLVCLDDLQAIAGLPDWEQALFNLFNRWYEQDKGSMIITGNNAPRHLGLTLPDLASRLDWGLIYQLYDIDDEQKIATLKLRAKMRGFELTDEVARFLLHRLSRRTHKLLYALDQLSTESIRAQRRLTIPFVKDSLCL